MIAGLVGGGDFGAGGKSAQGKAVGDSFGSDQDVGLDAVVLDGEHLAGAGEARLHFIRDKQNAVLVEDFFDFLESN